MQFCISGLFVFGISFYKSINTVFTFCVKLAVFGKVSGFGGGGRVCKVGVYPAYEKIDRGSEIVCKGREGEDVGLDVVVFIFVYRLLTNADNTCKLLLTDALFVPQFFQIFNHILTSYLHFNNNPLFCITINVSY